LFLEEPRWNSRPLSLLGYLESALRYYVCCADGNFITYYSLWRYNNRVLAIVSARRRDQRELHPRWILKDRASVSRVIRSMTPRLNCHDYIIYICVNNATRVEHKHVTSNAMRSSRMKKRENRRAVVDASSFTFTSR